MKISINTKLEKNSIVSVSARSIHVGNSFRNLILSVVLMATGMIGVTRAEELYWWPTAGSEGGTGTWDASNPGRWSTTSDVKTASSTVPADGDDVIFGGVGGTVSVGYIYSNPVPLLDEFIVNAPGYIFKSTAAIQIAKISLNSFGGTALNSAIFQADNNASRIWTLDIRSNTSFTGVIRDNDGTNTAKLGLAKLGAGLLDLTSATMNYTNGTLVFDGILRVNRGTGVPGALPNTALTLAGSNAVGSYVPPTFSPNGILEVVGDGDGTSYTMARTLGASLPTGIQLGYLNQNSKAGFGSINGNLVVALTDPAAEWSWGGSNFGASTLVLGTQSSTGVVTFANKIALNQAISTVEVVHGANSSYQIDAAFSGALRVINAANKLIKTGSGTLLLSENSPNFNGHLQVQQGAVLLGVGTSLVNANSSAQPIIVFNGGTLGGGGTIRLSNVAASIAVQSGGILQAGFGLATNDTFLDLDTQFQELTINSNLILEGGSILAFGLGALSYDSDRLTRTGGDWSFQNDQNVSFINQGGLVVGTTYTLITGLTSVMDVSLWNIVGDESIDGTFQYSSGNVYFTLSAVPEPSIGAFLFGAAILILTLRRAVASKRVREDLAAWR